MGSGNKSAGESVFVASRPRLYSVADSVSGAVREGSALLQGLAVCGQCGRKLRTHYTGRTASPGYHFAGKTIATGRGVYCLSIGAVQVDEAVARAVLSALEPLGIEAALAAAERLEADHDGAQWRLAVERAPCCVGSRRITQTRSL